MKEYWTIKAVENGRSLGRLANDGNYFANSDDHPPARFSSMVLAAAEVMRWREMRHCGTGTGPKYKLVHHTKKPRGAKVGTWAWACEQMVLGASVRIPCWGIRRKIALKSLNGSECQLCVRNIRDDGWRPDVPRVSDFTNTTWEVCT